MRFLRFIEAIDAPILTESMSQYEAAETIARDEDLFDAVATYTTWPDIFDDEPEQLKKLLAVLANTKPVKMRLYRGENAYEYNNYQPYPDHHQGFTSWTLSEEVMKKWFLDGHEKMAKYTDGPVQAVSISDIADARMRHAPGESHYGSQQAEYLVLEPVERLV